MNQYSKPQLVMVAGPNGAGKSTLVKANPELIKGTVYINPDEIVKQIASLYPQKPDVQHQIMAARKALEIYENCFAKQQSLSLETTLAGNTPLKTLRNAREQGYHIILAYVGVETSNHSITRVYERVQQGGHNVPIPDIVRRYARSMENLPMAIALADNTYIYDNSQAEHRMQLSLQQGYVKTIYSGQYPDWLRQRVIETSLKIGELLTFKNDSSNPVC